MSNHTPEPWRVGRPGTVVSDTPVPGMGGSDAVEYYGGHLIGESITEANARRIVACVNECEGISTERLEMAKQLELGPETFPVWKAYCEKKMQLEAVTEQRDELLEVLEEITEYAEMAMEQANKAGAEWEIGFALHDAKTAIAKAKGGAA